ncbi:hypothetical protein ABT275_35920 [Streptomyces sp. NPDC001185]|uniref:hypothetical protein n=1 Tax=Streptomyces sp. NPDC001185 TaxID=3154380 RepID=UPI00332F7349
MTDDLPQPPWQMDWTTEARQDFDAVPADGRQLVLAARAELITAQDPYHRGIDADACLPHWITVRPLASTRPGGPHIADLAGGREWLIFIFIRRHAVPQIIDRHSWRFVRWQSMRQASSWLILYLQLAVGAAEEIRESPTNGLFPLCGWACLQASDLCEYPA